MVVAERCLQIFPNLKTPRVLQEAFDANYNDLVVSLLNDGVVPDDKTVARAVCMTDRTIFSCMVKTNGTDVVRRPGVVAACFRNHDLLDQVLSWGAPVDEAAYVSMFYHCSIEKIQTSLHRFLEIDQAPCDSPRVLSQAMTSVNGVNKVRFLLRQGVISAQTVAKTLSLEILARSSIPSHFVLSYILDRNLVLPDMTDTWCRDLHRVYTKYCKGAMPIVCRRGLMYIHDLDKMNAELVSAHMDWGFQFRDAAQKYQETKAALCRVVSKDVVERCILPHLFG